MLHGVLVARVSTTTKEGRRESEDNRETGCDDCADTETLHHAAAFPLVVHLFDEFFQSHHGQEGDGEFSHDQCRRHRSELAVHGHMVDEQIGEPHQVMSPGEKHGQDGGGEQCPFHGVAVGHHQQRQHEEQTDESTHIDRAARTRLVTPVLGKIVVEPHLGELRVGILHGSLAGSQWYRCTSIHIRYQQRKSLALAITPVGDVTALQTTVGLVVGLTFLHQLALPAHGLFAVFIRMIEVGDVDGYGQCSGNN